MDVVEGDDSLPPAKRTNPSAELSPDEKTEEEDNSPHADARPYFFVRSPPRFLIFHIACQHPGEKDAAREA
jgi:hypothetical protein